MKTVIKGPGRGGKSFQDRKESSEARREILKCIRQVIADDQDILKWTEYKKDLILRMAPHILPRLNAGRDEEEQLFPREINISFK